MHNSIKKKCHVELFALLWLLLIFECCYTETSEKPIWLNFYYEISGSIRQALEASF